MTWDYLQYVLGLARLGHDVYYFEDSSQWPYNLDRGSSGNDWIAYDPTPNVAYVAKITDRKNKRLFRAGVLTCEEELQLMSARHLLQKITAFIIVLFFVFDQQLFLVHAVCVRPELSVPAQDQTDK